MPDVAPGEPVQLAGERTTIYATFHAAVTTTDPRTAVLICPPWGWDEIASYRSRRAWAEDLAGRGWPTLRIDLPGAGDSGGDPGDADLVQAWTNAIGTAAEWLRAETGATRVVTVGLGLGGLLALAALVAGAPIDELVAWASPASGRAWVREQRAFAALQSDRLDPGSEEAGDGMPAGSLEVGGFVLTAASIRDLENLEATPTAGQEPRRVLLLDRDAMGNDPRLVRALGESGIDVAEMHGDGWTRMVLHPERYAPPLEVFETVAAWIESGSGIETGTAAAAAPRRTVAPTPPRGDAAGSYAESPVWITRPFGRIYGILTEPPAGSRADVCAVFLNAGAVRRVGPNRMWVETARRWAGLGVPSIRMDLEGIGDADGDPHRFTDVGNFYTREFGAQVTSILDALEHRQLGPRFILVGLCAGAYWAFHTGATDPRVLAALTLNPRAMIWDSGLLARRDARDAGRALRVSTLRRVVRGEVSRTRIREVLSAFLARARAAATRIARRANPRPAPELTDPIVELLDSLRDLGTRTVIGFAGDEPVLDELRSDGILDRLERWPNLTIEALPGRDHTLRPIAAQRAARALLDRELHALLRPSRQQDAASAGRHEPTAGRSQPRPTAPSSSTNPAA